MKKELNKGLLVLVVILSLLVVGVSSYFIYDKVFKEDNTDDKKYVLEKYIETDVTLNNEFKIYEKNGLIFLYSNGINSKFLKIYDEYGNNVTPAKFDGKKLEQITPEYIDNVFLGFTLSVEGKKYYVNDKGKIILDLETMGIIVQRDYIIEYSDKVCFINAVDGYKYEHYCSKVYDLSGNLLIDGTVANYVILYDLYNENNNSLFVARNKEKNIGVINRNGNVVINFEYEDIEYIENKNIILCYKDDYSYDIYDLKGNLLNEIDFNDIEIIKDKEYGYVSLVEKEKVIYLNNTIYLIDENYDLKEIKNVYYSLVSGHDFVQNFYITDSIYIEDNNGVYTIHSLDGKKLLDDGFMFVGPVNEKGHVTIGVPNDYITLCKNSNRTNCGAIDFEGNIIVQFENELHDYQQQVSEDGKIYDMKFNGFKNGNQYFDIINNKVTKKITCDNLNNVYIIKYFENTIVVDDEQVKFENGGRKIIDYKCNDLSAAKYHNISEHDNFIVAENSDWITYDVYDTNGIIIDYENKENIEAKYFMGYSEGKLYFGNDKDIYVLRKK